MPWRSEDGKIHGGTYESWIDKQIREAHERGDFDDLPGTGKPLADPTTPSDPDWWIKQKVARERLDISAGLPLPLQLRKEAEAMPERILEERSEAAARQLVEDFNDRVRASWKEITDGPPVMARLVDAEALVAHWRDHHIKSGTEAEPAGAAADAPPRGLLFRVLGRLRRRPPL
jgi:hypothetical protein